MLGRERGARGELDEKGTTGTRGEGKNIWLGLDIYWEDIWVCLGLPFMFFFLLLLLWFLCSPAVQMDTACV